MSIDAPAPDDARLANRLLEGLPPAESAMIASHLTSFDTESGEILQEPGQSMDHVYFPTSGMISLVERGRDGTMVEVGTVGADGMVGISVFLGVADGASEAMAQVPGRVLALPADRFMAAAEQAPELRRRMERFTHLALTVSARNAACNRLHSIVERAARWLLLTRDRVGQDEFPLTQEFFASMLGSHRPGVTLAAGMLKKLGAVNYRRGRISIIDGARLEAAACECYGLMRDAYDKHDPATPSASRSARTQASTSGDGTTVRGG